MTRGRFSCHVSKVSCPVVVTSTITYDAKGNIYKTTDAGLTATGIAWFLAGPVGVGTGVLFEIASGFIIM